MNWRYLKRKMGMEVLLDCDESGVYIYIIYIYMRESVRERIGMTG